MDNRSFEQPPIPNDELPLDLRVAARGFAAQPVPRPSSADTAHLLHVLLTEAVLRRSVRRVRAALLSGKFLC